MRAFCISFLLMFGTTVVAQISSKPITEVSQKELESVVLIDVRTPEEFAAGHLEHARNINWYDADFAAQMATVDKEETIYLYCKMGGRSAKAQEKLKALGYTHVVNLEGGYASYEFFRKE
ncbi:rhodanese-like domain-containing protein [Maribacter sp. 2-571]|uniref:rhodanese-like domain-containing protein n=1 Tax=Maribacter sp. 2-571 TaxID=3417569 RepID=UPI003D32D075